MAVDCFGKNETGLYMGWGLKKLGKSYIPHMRAEVSRDTIFRSLFFDFFVLRLKFLRFSLPVT